MTLYLVTSALFLVLAGLFALDSALTSFHLFPWFNGLRWLRVHVITLGALTEVIFGILPVLAARRAGLKTPRPRWGIWLLLTVGLLILMVGIPLVNFVLIVTGGTLIFIAVLMMMAALRGLATPNASDTRTGSGRRFYLAGLAFFLFGIFLGSGLWFGWGAALRIANPLEVHIHTNIWGFMSLMFAGLAIDLYPRWTGRELAWPGSIRPIFWMMTLGALAAVLGPWLAVNPLMALGIFTQQAATVWLLVNMIRPLKGTTAVREPGIWHIITSYFWQLAIVLATPLIVLLNPGFSAAGVEQTAPQVLIYGWMLQFGYALIPYLLQRAVAPHQEAAPGGSWFSLAAVHTGGIFLAVSIFLPDLRIGALSLSTLGIAYLLWAVSFLPIALQLWSILKSEPRSADEAIPAGDPLVPLEDDRTTHR